MDTPNKKNATKIDLDRRFALKAIAIGSLMAGSLSLISCAKQPTFSMATAGDWQQADRIRSAIERPAFSNAIFSIVDFGARGDGQFDCSSAIAAAIKACNSAGGGKVLVPAGIYLTGPVHLLSNVNLHVEKGASVRFIPETKRHLPLVKTHWEGMELMGYSPLIYAYQQKNIAITGEGELDGSANDHTWWPWKGKRSDAHWDIIEGQDQKVARDRLMADVEAGTPLEQRQYGEGSYLRPPFVQPFECENVLIEGVTIKDSPFWLLNPVLCKNVTVSGVSFLSHGPNSDGCNPESCDHVLIENCTFNNGDDCIAIKSGRNNDGRRIATPSQNIVIANCNMRDGHGGVVIGSEISGGVNNVFVENCSMSSTELERAIRIKTNSVRGGLIEHIRIRNIEVGDVKNAIVVNFFYEEGDAGRFDPVVRDIVIENLTCENVIEMPMNLQGFPRAPMHDFHLVNCHFKRAGKPSIVHDVKGMTMASVTIAGKSVGVTDVTGA